MSLTRQTGTPVNRYSHINTCIATAPRSLCNDCLHSATSRYQQQLHAFSEKIATRTEISSSSLTRKSNPVLWMSKHAETPKLLLISVLASNSLTGALLSVAPDESERINYKSHLLTTNYHYYCNTFKTKSLSYLGNNVFAPRSHSKPFGSHCYRCRRQSHIARSSCNSRT